MRNDYSLCHGRRDAVGLKLAAGLGWFSIGLGLMELLATRALTRALGMRGRETLVQMYGWREVAAGVAILSSRDPTPWIWGRVLGDALDLGTLATHLNADNPEEENVTIALGNVAAVTALDVYCAMRLSAHEARRTPARDYSRRSGLPRSPESMRGAASDFEVPRDMRAPEAMRPYSAGASRL